MLLICYLFVLCSAIMYPRAVSKSACWLATEARNPAIRLSLPLSLGYTHSNCNGKGEGGKAKRGKEIRLVPDSRLEI